jgi:hypothetical protein
MATKSNDSDGFTFNYEMKLDFNELGLPSSLYVKAEPEEQEAVNSAIRAALDGVREPSSRSSRPSTQKPFSEAIPEYFSKSQTKAQTKATYRSKLDHAQKFFERCQRRAENRPSGFRELLRSRDGDRAEHYVTGSLHDHCRNLPELVSRQISRPTFTHDKNPSAEKGLARVRRSGRFQPVTAWLCVREREAVSTK